MGSRTIERCVGVWSLLLLASACSGGSDATPITPSAGAGMPNGSAGVSNGSGGSGNPGGAAAHGGTASASGGASSGNGQAGTQSPSSDSPTVGGCAILPKNHLFNTPIDALPTHAGSADFMKAVGTRNIHLDLGTSVDQKSDEYYGIPYNVVHSQSIPWQTGLFTTTDQDNFGWDPTQESDCAVGDTHQLKSPCTGTSAAKPQFPIPAAPLVEGGIITDPAQPYGDHHLLLLDADTCSLWELYHVYPDP
ncbi:MAG TPA: hypothetical protein VFK05_21535, partial [Polyangiaceae bacterium]|nr:hypothetical protein [Polyangiaceae bacterium]